jgi:hypothetical protein
MRGMTKTASVFLKQMTCLRIVQRESELEYDELYVT